MQLQLPSGAACEVKSGYANPHLSVHPIHLKMFFTLGPPELGIFLVELREIQFGQRSVSMRKVLCAVLELGVGNTAQIQTTRNKI